MKVRALARIAGAMALALALMATPSLSFDTGGDDDDGGSSGGGSSSSSSPAIPSLGDVRADIKAKRWEKAIDKLGLIVEANPSSADAYNLLGYSFRNLGNRQRAMSAYNRALKLDPKHTGALEYQGVLFVMLGDLDKANANLAKIKTICGTGCEEYEDLAEAING
ncbi:MAG: tetratricopeptide repeat protein [Devosia sp.]